MILREQFHNLPTFINVCRRRVGKFWVFGQKWSSKNTIVADMVQISDLVRFQTIFINCWSILVLKLKMRTEFAPIFHGLVRFFIKVVRKKTF